MDLYCECAVVGAQDSKEYFQDDLSGEELKIETAVRVGYNGKVYYVGCENCKAQFLKDYENKG